MGTGVWCGAATVACLVVGLTGCQIAISGLQPQAEAGFDLSAAATGITSLDIDWWNGEVSVRVDGTAGEVTASGRKFASAAGSDPAESVIPAIDIELATDETDSSKLVLSFDGPTAAVIGADVEVVLPASVALIIESTNGEVRVAGNEDTTSILLTNGSVIVDGQVGDCSVLTDNGRVEVTSRDGDVDVRVDAGDIDIDAAPPLDGTVWAHGEAGSITLRVPTELAASLQLASDVGTVNALLGGFVVTGLQQNFRSVTATLNGGGGTIIGELSVGTVRFGVLP